MAWDQYDWNTIVVGGTTYNFAPTQLVYVGTPQFQVNQIAQESEAGIVKVQILDTNVRELYEFVLNRMPYSDYTIGATTIRGYNSLYTLVATGCNFRENTATISLEGDPVGTTHTTRYWSDTFGPHPVVRKVGSGVNAVRYYGDGSTSVVFREEIT